MKPIPPTPHAAKDDEREFLVSFGLVSNRGNVSRPTPYHDKVTRESTDLNSNSVKCNAAQNTRARTHTYARTMIRHKNILVYSGIEGAPGTGDIWAVNTLLTQLPDSGEYTAQGIELDFNNENAHRG